MINFNDIKYERIDYFKTKIELEKLFKQLELSDNYKEFFDLFKKINSIQNHIEEMYDYADINNMRDFNNLFYDEEMNYWNQFKPKFDLLFVSFYQIILNSKYLIELKKIIPDNFFRIIETKVNKVDVSDLEIKENELKKQYRDLNKNRIIFNGEETSIAKLTSFFKSQDRKIRKHAHDCLNDYYFKYSFEYKTILFELIKIRNLIAKQYGFKNYKEYSLYKLKRFDYNYDDITMFRNNVIKYIVPIIKRFRVLQLKELGLNNLQYYDTIFFIDMPKINLYGKNLILKMIDVFKNIDMDFYQFAKDMFNNNYIDLEQRDDKVNFSITNYLVESKTPVITGNFKNNYLDVITFSHEMGHAFQKYCASLKDNKNVSPLLKYPTMEIAEMFSYAMELIVTDEANELFIKDYPKFKFMEIHKLISNLPYICLVDEFQEIIYSKNILQLDDLNKIWNQLVLKYNLEISNTGHINLENGGYFYRQSHIYLDPFYYIDYGLSYFGTFAIKDKCKDNLNFFKEVGSVASYYSFKDLILKYDLPNPFDSRQVEKLSEKIKQLL